MATVIKITKHHDMGLYDSDTGTTLKTKKAVEITDDCPLASQTERALLLFTKAKRGRIVQIVRPYPGEVCMGAHTHFFVDELEGPIAERDDTFKSLAHQLGLSRPAFVEMVRAHAPRC